MGLLRKILIAPFLGYFGTMTRLFEKREITPRDFGDFSSFFEYGKGSTFTLYKSVTLSGNTTTTYYGVLETKKDGKTTHHNFDNLEVKTKDGYSLKSTARGHLSNGDAWYFMTDFTLKQMDTFWLNKGELVLNKNVKFTISGKLIHLDLSIDDVRENKLNALLSN